VFAGWSSGPCSGTALTCTFSPAAVTAIAATFDKAPKPTPKTTQAANAPPPTSLSATVSDSPNAAPTDVVEAATAVASASGSPSAAPSGLDSGTDPNSSGADLTPIAVAIVVAGLAIAGGLAIGLRPRGVKPPPAPPAVPPTPAD
jgi:hypothetical protein